MDNDCKQSDAAAIIEFARETTEPQVITVTFEGTPEEVLVTSDADGETRFTTVRDLFEDRAAAPLRRRGTIQVHDLDTFVEATNRDSDGGSVIFADVPQRALTAILDFHKPGRDPRWGQDRIEYGFTFSPQLTAWAQAARAPMDQKTFSRLIDDRVGDIGESDPLPGSIAEDFARRRGIRFASVADLLVFTRTIATKSTTDSTDIYDEKTGGSSIQYTKRNDVKTPDGQPVAVPDAFVLKIPIFCGKATEFMIAVRLRYDITEKGIAWRIELNALDRYILAAIEEALVLVRLPKSEKPDSPGGCGLPVFMGSPPG